jgi:membrane protein implicated in regulation of membrane protease activity
MSNFMPYERIEWFAEPGIAEVVKMITPQQRGRVKFQASFWPARLHPDVQAQALPSERVVVVGRDGITLLVTPLAMARTA